MGCISSATIAGPDRGEPSLPRRGIEIIFGEGRTGRRFIQLDLDGMGPVALSPVQTEANREGVARMKVEMYVEEISIEFPDADL